MGQDLAAVLTLGDHQYDKDQYENYQQVFDPTWGRVKDLIRPVIGNHEYLTTGAAGYFDYFNGVGQQSGPAGDRSTAYYSYEIGDWHVVALNSNCSQLVDPQSTTGGCGADSLQAQWLREDLAAHPTSCTLAYFHHPRFSAGTPGNNTEVKPLWQALYDADVDLILNGHAHGYERFAPQSPSGELDPSRGIREFVVGTGGKSLSTFPSTRPNTDVRDNTTFGVLKVTLDPDSYAWDFEPEAGGRFTDTGEQACH